jgi:hypothetical protein
MEGVISTTISGSLVGSVGGRSLIGNYATATTRLPHRKLPNQCAKKRSASMAAMHPVPAAVIAWR